MNETHASMLEYRESLIALCETVTSMLDFDIRDTEQTQQLLREIGYLLQRAAVLTHDLLEAMRGPSGKN